MMSLSLFAVSYLLVTFVSLVDALDVHNEETRLHTTGLLSSLVSVLTAWSSSSTCAPQLPLPSLAPFYFYTWRGSGLHCNHCGQDGHVESFCYRKKNQRVAYRSSKTSNPTTGGPATLEMLMLLHRLAPSAPPGVAGSVAQSLALTGGHAWILDSGVSFHMTPYSTHLSSMRAPSHSLIIDTTDGSPLPVAGQGTLLSTTFHVPDVSYVPDLKRCSLCRGVRYVYLGV